MVGEEKRHQMMQNLFGDQSEEEDEEEEIESEHESNRQPDYASDDGGVPPDEGEGEVEGQGEVEIESDGAQEFDPVNGESEDEIDKGIQEVEADDHRDVNERHYSESDDKEEYDQHVVTSRRRNAIQSDSEQSGENHYVANEEDEVAMSPRKLAGDEKEDQYIQSAPEIHDVFGDSDDEDEEAQYEVRNQIEGDENRSPMEEDENFGREVRPDDMMPEEYALYDSEEEHVEVKTKEKPVGPPLELEIPLYPPPAEPDQMHMIKVSNIMGIDSKPFDPNTYVEEDFYVTEESGAKKRIRLENNVVRWRKVKNPNGTTSIESNARFVEWSDGSLQLLIGNEVLDISKQDAQHEQAHLFLRHGKGILQSQGRILRKMRFMPSSLASNSHRLLTAIVDSRHKKVYRVKNCITDIDPEREKEQREKAANQSIKANELLSRKKEKVGRKYTQPTIRRERQLSPGFLEDALEEDEDQDYYEPRRSTSRRRVEEDLEMEARAEKRIMNAKKGSKDTTRRSSMAASRSSSRRPVEYSESEREEESEYETEGEEEEEGADEEARDQYAEEDEELEHGGEEEAYGDSEEEAEEPKHKAKESGGGGRLKRKGIESDMDDSPQKASAHRRKKMVYDSDDDE